MLKTPIQIVYESGERRKAKIRSLKEREANESKRLLAIWDKKEQRKVKKKIEALERKAHGKKPLSKAKKKLSKTDVLEAIQLKRKLEETDSKGMVSCISSGVKYHWTEVCGGHYETRTNNATAFLDWNIRPQCTTDNWKMSRTDNNALATKAKYRANVIKIIGLQEFKRLEATIEKSRYTVNKIPDNLKDIYDYSIEKSVGIIIGKGFKVKKGTVAYKLVGKYLPKENIE